MAAAHSRVQAAQEGFDAILAWAADSEDFWTVWAKAEAHLLLAKATLRHLEAEAAQTETQCHLRKRDLHLSRNLRRGP